MVGARLPRGLWRTEALAALGLVLGCAQAASGQVGEAGAGSDASTPPLEIPAPWLRLVPGPREAELIEQGAERRGWPAMSGALARGALEAYGRGNLATAGAWLNVARWAEAWAETEGAADARWRVAMAAAGWPGGYRFEPEPPARPDSPMAGRFSAELRVRLMADPLLSAEYFTLETAVDRRAEAFTLLARLAARAPDDFRAKGALAVAIALVHDVPPPRDWPHWQVEEDVLPRRLAAPEEVFDYLARLDADGKALQKLDTLDAAELRFLVDIALPEDQRGWAQANVRTPLSKLAETYAIISYRSDRLETESYVWAGKSYTLADILREGGICVDQAYFASQAGKARGVPTLVFRGAALDGRHAWFGYLGAGQRWNMEAGRDRGQNQITGLAHDPQTWLDISDHELAFLSEGFRREKNARDSSLHGEFAERLRKAGRLREAEIAARTAVRLERRNLKAWDTLLALDEKPGATREALAREAAGGLTAYPESQARFLGLAIASLRERGETEEADRLGREMARRFAGKRGDLTVLEVAAQLKRVQETQATDEQMKVYRTVLRQFGRRAGAGLWDEAVKPFVVRLIETGKLKEAREALILAREALAVASGSQLDREMRTVAEALEKHIKSVKAGAEEPR